MKLTILSISGKPGLYKLLSNGRTNLIVEALDGTHKRLPVFATDRVTSLNDIAMYTYDEDVPLMNILQTLKETEEGKKVALNYKKCSSKELREYFAKILPDFDQERVHDNDIKKLLQWYNLLIDNDITDFVDAQETEADGESNEKEG